MQTIQTPQSNTYSRFMPYVAAGIAAGATTYFLYRWLKPTAPFIAPHVEDQLPVAKNLKTIPDVEGNYDIDGVSFDSEGVVVSGDENNANSPNLINPS